MIYVITTGSYSDYEIYGLYEGPDGIDARATSEHWDKIYNDLYGKFRRAQVMLCQEYGVPYLSALFTDDKPAYDEAMEKQRALAPYPYISTIIDTWLAEHPEFTRIEWKEIHCND